jgi:hypothetical protein
MQAALVLSNTEEARFRTWCTLYCRSRYQVFSHPETPFTIPSSIRLQHLVGLLMDKGPDVHAQDGEYRTVL